jgi:hypothetical protein
VALTFAEPVGAGTGFSRKLIYPEIGVVVGRSVVIGDKDVAFRQQFQQM